MKGTGPRGMAFGPGRHGHHRPPGLAQHLLGCGAEEQPFEAGSPVRAHHDQIDAQAVGLRQDFPVDIRRLLDQDVDPHARDLFGADEPLHLLRHQTPVDGRQHHRWRGIGSDVVRGRRHDPRRRHDVQRGDGRSIAARDTKRVIQRPAGEVGKVHGTENLFELDH